jgi:hypothetical protein
MIPTLSSTLGKSNSLRHQRSRCPSFRRQFNWSVLDRRKLGWTLGSCTRWPTFGDEGNILASRHLLPRCREPGTWYLIITGAVNGFLFGCIVQKTTDERRSRVKILYWLFAMAVFGLCLGFGKGVQTRTTLMVMAWTLGIGVVAGLLQYFLQSTRTPPPPAKSTPPQPTPGTKTG